MKLRQELTRAVFEELYYAANNQKIADKNKVDYQEGLGKSHADSAAQSHDSYMKDMEKSCAQNRESYIKDPEKSCAESAAQSHKYYKKDLKKRVTEMKLARLYPTKVRNSYSLVDLASDHT